MRMQHQARATHEGTYSGRQRVARPRKASPASVEASRPRTTRRGREAGHLKLGLEAALVGSGDAQGEALGVLGEEHDVDARQLRDRAVVPAHGEAVRGRVVRGHLAEGTHARTQPGTRGHYEERKGRV